MTAIPSKASLTGSTVTQGQFKTSLDTLNDYLTGLLGSDGTPATARTALGVINATAPTYAQVISALGYTPPQSGGTGASGTWPINISGNAATVGGASATSFATADFVNQSFSLFQTFGSLAAGASRTVGSPSYSIWSSYSSTQTSRGVYYTNMFSCRQLAAEKARQQYRSILGIVGKLYGITAPLSPCKLTWQQSSTLHPTIPTLFRFVRTVRRSEVTEPTRLGACKPRLWDLHCAAQQHSHI